MSDKKNIDRLFQEKFKNFEATPDPAVWEQINTSLHGEKRKRRVFAIWWKIGGIAALLVLLFTVGIVSYTNLETPENTTPLVNSSSEENNSKTIKNNTKAIDTTTDTTIISDNEAADKITNTTSKNTTITDTANNLKDDSEVLNSENSGVKKKSNTAHRPTNTVVTTKTKSKNTVATTNLKNSLEDKQIQKTSNTNVSNTQKTATKSPSETNKLSSLNTLSAIENRKKETQNNLKNLPEHNKSTVTVAKSASEEDKNNIETPETITKSVAETKTIEDAIKENDSIEKTIENTQKLSRWSIAPTVAPVYFNSLGKGSSLDDQFVNNSKNSDVTMSYGLNGSYAVNNKIKVRLGVHKVDLSYTTNNVITYKKAEINQGNSRVGNIKFNESASENSIMSAQIFNNLSSPESINSLNKNSINQQFGFIEIPLEIEYALISNKFGVNVIGGFSTFFVNKNEIYSVTNTSRTRIGEATNMNDISYSANIGFGVNYKLSNKLNINLEPQFKYQIETFSNTSGEFQPYFIGVYSGLSYKF
ncbi:hypothetical protein [Lacinutrix undariae]